MYTITPLPAHDLRDYAIWLVSLLLVAFGFRFVKEIIAFVLEKLYGFFIQQNQVI